MSALVAKAPLSLSAGLKRYPQAVPSVGDTSHAGLQETPAARRLRTSVLFNGRRVRTGRVRM